MGYSRRKKLRQALIYCLLTVGGIITLFPLIWMISGSFKTPAEIFQLQIIPDNPTLQNYIYIFQDTLFPRWFINSVIVAVAVVVSSVFFESLIGYIIAKFRFPGRKIIFLSILATLMVPVEMLIIPWYVMSNFLNWTDTYWGIMFPGVISAFGIFLMKQFFESVPSDLLNAARIDGMGEFGIFIKVALPQVFPALSALVIFTFLGNWNAYLWPLIVTESESLRTLPVGMAFFAGEFERSWELIMAGATIAALPLIILFLFLQRHIIKGITLTGMK